MSKEQNIAVCHVSSLHSAIDTRITQKEVFSLAQDGYVVHCVFAKGPWPQSVPDNVILHKVKYFETKILRWLVTCPIAIYKAAMLPAKVYHFHDPEMLLPSMLLKLKGAKIIYDVHEDLPVQIFAKDWIPKFLKTPCSKLVSFLLMLSNLWVDRYIVVTASIANKFPASKTNLVRNFPRLDRFINLTPIEKRDLKVVYLGSITEQRGVLDVIDALAMTKNIKTMDLAGPVSDELMVKLKQSPGWHKVVYHGHIDPKEIPDFMSQSRLGLVPLKPYANYQDSLPVKLFEYMAAGVVPMVSNFSNFSEFIVENDKCGVMLEPHNPQAWAKAMDELILDNQLLCQYSIAAQKKVNQNYSWATEEQSLLKSYRLL